MAGNRKSEPIMHKNMIAPKTFEEVQEIPIKEED